MLKYLIVILSVVVVGNSAGAATTGPLASTSSVVSAPAGDGTVSLQLFDTSLGTLTGVSISLFGSWSEEYTALAATGGGTASGADLFATGSASFVSSSIGIFATGVSSKDGDAFSETIPPIYQQSIGGIWGPTNVTLVGALSAFEDNGAGTFDLTYNGTANFDTVITGGVLDGGVAFSWNLDATVTYTYDQALAPVPLPAAGWMLLACLGGLGLMAQRRSKAA